MLHYSEFTKSIFMISESFTGLRLACIKIHIASFEGRHGMHPVLCVELAKTKTKRTDVKSNRETATGGSSSGASGKRPYSRAKLDARTTKMTGRFNAIVLPALNNRSGGSSGGSSSDAAVSASGSDSGEAEAETDAPPNVVVPRRCPVPPCTTAAVAAAATPLCLPLVLPPVKLKLKQTPS